MTTIKSYLKYVPGIGLTLIKAKYNNGRTALRGVDSATGEVVVTFTVNIPDYPLKDNELLIKDYSENEGALETLFKADLIKITEWEIPCGYETVTLCEIIETHTI
jgi:hypothetical protein